jgi:flagellin-like protein
MNRIRKDNEGVSPVIATILMVAITVVLAGVLVVYLQTLPTSGGSVETQYGLRVERTSNNDWLITITGGSQIATTVTVQIVDPTTGAIVATTLANPGTYNFPISPAGGWGAAAATYCGVWNNNNGAANTKLDAGDSILFYMLSAAHTNGKDLSGMKVQFMKTGNIIGSIGELPS